MKEHLENDFEKRKQLWKQAYCTLARFKAICWKIKNGGTKKMWKEAYKTFARFKAICREIAGGRMGRKRKPGRLRCGCEPHGHKCLIMEGGCGRCVAHCICPNWGG